MTPPPAPLPPACGNCITATKLAVPGAQPQQEPSQLFRSSDGKMRIDSGKLTTIADPAKGQTIVLDHVKKEATIFPMPHAPAMQMPHMPQMPGVPPPGTPPGVKVEELGKGFIEGHEVEGHRITMPPTRPPAMPKPPELPKLPGMPQAPAPPKPPEPPPTPTVSEVWTSTKLKMPVLTKTSGAFGQQVCHCKYSEGEPPPHLFQVPPEYKTVHAPPLPKR